MTPRVGYVFRMFPQLSETFVANEVLGLERLGIDLRLYSYRRPRAQVPHECVRSIRAPLYYLPDPLDRHPWQLLRAQGAIARLEPARYRATLRWVAGNTLRVRKPDTWRRFLQAACVAASARRAGVQHLHAHFAHGATRVAMIASMLTGIPFSFTAHAYDIFTAKRSYLKKKIEAAAYVVTCTRSNQEHLQELVAAETRHKVKLVYHGVDLAKFTPGPARERDTEPLVLAVGRLVEKKGLPELLRACSVLRRRGCAFRCLILGEGPQRPLLEARVRELGLQATVSLPGALSQEELLGFYRRATVFALPCRVLPNGDRDGIPNVLLEAMAVGVPVVATAVSGIPELIEDRDNGLLLKDTDGDQLADALERLLTDAALRRRLAAGGRATVEQRFDAGRAVRALVDLLPDPAPAAAG